MRGFFFPPSTLFEQPGTYTLTQSGLKVCSGVDYTFSFARLIFFQPGTCRLTVTLSGGRSGLIAAPFSYQRVHT